MVSTLTGSNPAVFRPQTVAEAVTLLAAFPEAWPISGGASLVAMMNAGLVAPGALVSLTRVAELCGLRVSPDGSITIGAATRHNAIARDGRLIGTAAVLSRAAAQIAGEAVRNMGTIGGAIAHADPGLDFPPALYALDATVEIAAKAESRRVPVREFFVDWYTTALRPGEIVVAIVIPKPKAGVGLYLKHARVAGDFAIASVALSLAHDGEVRVAIGGCGPTPLTSSEANRILSADPSASSIERAGELLVELANPVDDVRGTAEYRRLLIPRMLCRALEDGLAAAKGAA
jgi:aerobic carbon-monoxide dehydrogenase medium subunit